MCYFLLYALTSCSYSINDVLVYPLCLQVRTASVVYAAVGVWCPGVTGVVLALLLLNFTRASSSRPNRNSQNLLLM